MKTITICLAILVICLGYKMAFSPAVTESPVVVPAPPAVPTVPTATNTYVLVPPPDHKTHMGMDDIDK